VLVDIVGCDFEFVPVRVLKVNGVRYFVILKLEGYSSFPQFLLRGGKTLLIGPEGKMQNSRASGASAEVLFA